MTKGNGFLSAFDSPALVVTARSERGRSGCIAAFATQCSIYPPRLLVCLSVLNKTTEVAERAESIGVHLLRSDQAQIAALFGEETGDEIDKLATVRWHAGKLGAPILDDCAAAFEGSVVGRLQLGDHVGYLLDVVDSDDLPRDEDVMMRSAIERLDPGHPADEVLHTTSGSPDREVTELDGRVR
jgi:flavin reductase (DIM6/NTAB) family NADH-FMN oxidoreductase RutF